MVPTTLLVFLKEFFVTVKFWDSWIRVWKMGRAEEEEDKKKTKTSGFTGS